MLDVLSTAEELGKPIGSDLEENKNTYMVLMGREGCEKTIAKLTDFAKNVLLMKPLKIRLSLRNFCRRAFHQR